MKEAQIGSIPMIFAMVRISVQVFDEIQHKVVVGKIIQRTDAGVVKMLMQVFTKISVAKLLKDVNLGPIIWRKEGIVTYSP